MVLNSDSVHSKGNCIPSHPAGNEHAVQLQPDLASGNSLRVNQPVKVQLLDVDHGKQSVLAIGIDYVRAVQKIQFPDHEMWERAAFIFGAGIREPEYVKI